MYSRVQVILLTSSSRCIRHRYKVIPVQPFASKRQSCPSRPVIHSSVLSSPSLVGVLGVDLLASGLLKQAASTVRDLLGRVGVDVVARLLGEGVEGLVAVVLLLATRLGVAGLGVAGHRVGVTRGVGVSGE